MNEPLTEAQKTMVAGCAWDTHSHAAIKQALARLDHLERRLAQADDLYQCLLACHSCGCQRPGCSWCRDDAAVSRAVANWDAGSSDNEETI